MKIAIDVRPLLTEKTGVGNYIYNILLKLSEIDKENSYFLYAHKDFPMPVEKKNWKKRIGYGLFAKLGSIWLTTQAVKFLKEDNIDLFWGTGHILPFWRPKKTKTVLTIHDLVYYFYPETMSFKVYWINKLLLHSSIKKSNQIVTDAHSTVDQLQKVFNIDKNSLKVISVGVSEQYHPCHNLTARTDIKKLYGIEGEYILTVGTIEPRKNINALLESFARLQKKHKDIVLVIAGGAGWKNSTVYKKVAELTLSEKVKFLGYVPENDLPKLYSCAKLFVFLSLYEGFGLPPLEAMACGTPVITSNTSSLPEVVGEAGILVDPLDINEIVQSMDKVLKDENLQKEMVEKGLKQAKIFSWQKTAEEILNTFREVYKQDNL